MSPTSPLHHNRWRNWMTSTPDALPPPEALPRLRDAVRGRQEQTVRFPTRYTKPPTGTRPQLIAQPRDRPAPPPEQPDIWAIIERAQGGDPEAFGQLYDRYKAVVFRFIYYRVNGDRQLAEDLTADTFMRAIKSLGRFENRGRDIGAWLVTIARNLIADHFKACRTRYEVPTGNIRADIEARADVHQDGPENVAIAHLTNDILIEALKQLKGDQKECVVLRFIEGLSVVETARAMDKTEGAVKALQYRAMHTLAKLVPEGLRP